MALLAGTWGGLAAILLQVSISFFFIVQKMCLPYFLGPVVASFLFGVFLYTRAPSIGGSGTGEYVAAVNRHQGYISPILVPYKILGTALLLGFGGSGGVEGPMTLVGGGFSASLFRVFPGLGDYFDANTKRIGTICGAAGALGAIFRSPLGGGIFAVEVLYRSSLHYEELFPAILSSSIGYTIHAIFFDHRPLFYSPPFTPKMESILWFILAALLSGFVSLLFKTFFKRVRVYLAKNTLHSFTRPLLGGILTSILGLLIGPKILGMGTDVIQELINSPFPPFLLLLLLIGKFFASLFTIATGGSGGLILPALFIGACCGNLLSSLFSFLSYSPHFSVVVSAMAASLAAMANVPIAAAVMIIEMLGLHHGIPATLGSIIGYEIGRSEEIYRWIKMKKRDHWSKEFRKKDRDLNEGE